MEPALGRGDSYVAQRPERKIGPLGTRTAAYGGTKHDGNHEPVTTQTHVRCVARSVASSFFEPRVTSAHKCATACGVTALDLASASRELVPLALLSATRGLDSIASLGKTDTLDGMAARERSDRLRGSRMNLRAFRSFKRWPAALATLLFLMTALFGRAQLVKSSIECELDPAQTAAIAAATSAKLARWKPRLSGRGRVSLTPLDVDDGVDDTDNDSDCRLPPAPPALPAQSVATLEIAHPLVTLAPFATLTACLRSRELPKWTDARGPPTA